MRTATSGGRHEDLVQRGLEHRGGYAVAGRSRGRRRWAPITAFAIAPNTAMPTALPIDRANMLVPVTTPRLDQSTEDCAATRVGLATRPMPRPITKQVSATYQTLQSRVQQHQQHGADASDRGPDQRRVPEADPQVDPAGHGGGDRPADGQRGQREAGDQRARCRARPGRTAGTYEVSPISITPTARLVRLAPTSSRRRNTQPGTIGSAARRSTTTNAARADTAEAEHADAPRRQPGPQHAAFEQPEDQQRAGQGEQDGARDVDPVRACAPRPR